MNIQIISHCYPAYDGDIAAPFIPPFAKVLSSSGVGVSILTPARHSSPGDPNVIWYPWRAIDKPLGRFRMISPKELLSLRSLIENGVNWAARIGSENSIDLNFALWAFPSGYIAYRVKKKHSTPYAVWALGSDIYVYGRKPILSSIVKTVLRNADILFADGFELARRVEEISGKGCHFLPTGRNLPDNLDMPALDKSRLNLLFIGRWESIKGVDILVRSFANAGLKNAFLHIVGGGSLEKWLVDFIRENNLSNEVFLHKNIPTTLLVGFLRSCDYLIIPSRSESIPLVLSEAARNNLPLVVSDVGDMGMLVEKYRAGYVFPSEDEASLVRILQQLPQAKGEKFLPGLSMLADILDIEKGATRFIKRVSSFLEGENG
ncbi:hypothetical protein DRQ19_04125 [bacterium]|nr:MAG: hypothetical protein DRQ19_04125 [bacterium]